MHKSLIKLLICTFALCSVSNLSYAADSCSFENQTPLPASTKKESLKLRLSVTRKISKTIGGYLALTFDAIAQRGIKFKACQFSDRNNKVMADTTSLADCFTEKFYHDLNYKNDGLLRILVINNQGQGSWTTVKWTHAKLKTKTDEVGFKGIVQKFKGNNWLKFYKNALNHNIEINLENPMTFKLEQTAFNVLEDVSKIAISLSVDEDTEELHGSLKLTDHLGDLTGALKSDFNIVGQIKNELSNKKCLPSFLKYNEFKFFSIVNRVETDQSLDQLPPVIIQGRN